MKQIEPFFESVCAQPIAQTRYYRIGETPIAFHFLSLRDLPFFTRSLRHLEKVGLETPFLFNLYVLSGDTSGIAPPFDLCFKSDKSLYSNDLQELPSRYFVNVDTWLRAVSLLDYETNTGIYWCKTIEKMPLYVHTAPFLQLLQRWFIHTPLTFIHSGGIGYAQGGVILGGKGGSGKSTTTMACFDSDLHYIGDDFLMVDRQHSTAYSLYQVAKLEIHNSFRFPHLKPHLTNTAALPPEKHHLWIHELQASKMIQTFPVKAIFLPKFLGKKDTQLKPASKVDAMKALVPSSTWLIKADTTQMNKIAQIVRQLPCYWLETGTDLPQIPFTIRQFLATC